jgi:hypothetical protein
VVQDAARAPDVARESAEKEPDDDFMALDRYRRPRAQRRDGVQQQQQ